MNKKEEKIFIDILSDLHKTTHSLIDILTSLSFDIQILSISVSNLDKPTKESITKSLFPHLFTDEIMEFNRREKFLKSLDINLGFDEKDKL